MVHVTAEDESRHWVFDARGRPVFGREGDRQVQFGLSGEALVRVGDRTSGYAEPQRLPAVATWALLIRARAAAAAALRSADGSDPLRLAALTAAAGWDMAAERRHRSLFGQAYRPTRMLPSDAYRALLVQLTEGCSWGKCRFCTLYKDTPFRAKGPADLEAHLDLIAEVLGPGVCLRRGVFLGDANACLLPQERLLGAMGAVQERFPAPAAEGMQAFIDAFTGPGKSRQELEELRAAGLTRVTLGLESGHEPLVQALNKPATPGDAVALTERLKQAGIAVSLTVLVGAEASAGIPPGPGRADLAARHVRDTLRLLCALPLERGDRVYLSPLHPAPPDADAELQEQHMRMRAGLAGLPFQVAPYDLTRWIY